MSGDDPGGQIQGLCPTHLQPGALNFGPDAIMDRCGDAGRSAHPSLAGSSLTWSMKICYLPQGGQR